MSADLRTVLAVVSVLRWGLDDIDVRTLCWVCGPLDWYTRPAGAGGDAMKEFKFQNKEMVDGFVPLANSCSGVEDGILILVEKA